MKVAVLGTGMVGRAHAAKLSELGHDAVIGTQDVDHTLRSSQSDAMGNPPFREWHKDHSQIRVATYHNAVRGADLVIEALNGKIAVAALTALENELAGKVVIDIGNPLDLATGSPQLFVCNTDSLGEQLQRALPHARVVKTLCTVTADVQVHPERIAHGDHHMFVAGNDADAKQLVVALLHQYGWQHVIDIGDISAARALEMLFPMWMKLMKALGTIHFNYRVLH